MKIEAGKFYRTRDGRKAWVASTVCPLDDHRPIIGRVNGPHGAASWRADGIWGRDSTSDLDLIAPWVEPPWDYEPKPGDDVWVFNEGAVCLYRKISRANIDFFKGYCHVAKAEVPEPPK